MAAAGVVWVRRIAAAAAALAASAALAQMPGLTRDAIGLTLSGKEDRLLCGASALACDGRGFTGGHWGVELGVVDLGRASTALAGTGRVQGLNLSLVGRKPLIGGLGLYGRLGTTWTAAESLGSLAPGAVDGGAGLSYGAGLSMEFTPRLSATFGWEGHDLRLTGGGNGLKATSLGLQWRY